MAKVEFDPSVAGFRGKMGGMVYREQYGKTVVAGAYRRKKPWTATQRKGHQRFPEAQADAKAVLALGARGARGLLVRPPKSHPHSK